MLTHIHSLQRTQPHALKHKPVVGFHAGRESQLEKVRNILRGPVVQTQLKIGAPNDKYEQEADRVAEQVMRMPEPQVTASSGVIQRACTSCLEENQPEEGVIQTKPIMSEPSKLTQAPSIVHDVLRSPGQPLDEQTRAFMEPRFGYDFSQVRVHTDDKAAESARAVNARAYTVGQDVVMRLEEYAPATEVGRRLLAHELVHVVQQGDGEHLQRLSVGVARDVYEREADRVVRMSQFTETGECYTCDLPGGIGICCYAKNVPIVPECLDLGKRIIDGCRDSRDECKRKAHCAQCQCIGQNLGEQYCQCTGIV